MDCNPTICRKIDDKVIQVEGEIYGCLKMQNTSIVDLKSLISSLMDPDDGSVEPKRYSVDFLINLSFHLD